MDNLIETLRRAHLFTQLSQEQIERVARKARHVTVAEGKTLFAQGDPAERFFLVVSGQLKLFRLSPEGNEKVIEIITPGHTFAEALMFLERPRYPVGCTALLPAEVIAVDARDFNQMLRGSAETCLLLLGELSARLRGLVREIDELSLQSATCRIAGYLLKRAPTDVDEFQLDIPKGVIASRLSVKPETFSRIIRQLAEGGVIEVHGSMVRIRDRAALRREADVCGAPPETGPGPHPPLHA